MLGREWLSRRPGAQSRDREIQLRDAGEKEWDREAKNGDGGGAAGRAGMWRHNKPRLSAFPSRGCGPRKLRLCQFLSTVDADCLTLRHSRGLPFASFSSSSQAGDNFMGRSFVPAVCIMLVTIVSGCERQAQTSWVVDLTKVPNRASRAGCPILAWIHNGSSIPYPPNQQVIFSDSQSGQTLATVTADQAAKAYTTVHWKTNVIAKVSPSWGGAPLASNVFGCPDNTISNH